MAKRSKKRIVTPSDKPWESPWAEQLMPLLWRIMHGAMEGIFKLDLDAREMVFEEMAKECADHYYEVSGLSTLGPDGTIDIDTLISEVPPRALPLVRKIWREGDTIYWDAHCGAFGVGCMCALKLLGVLDEPRVEMCDCGKYFQKRIIERATGRQVKPMVTSTLLRGDKEACRFLPRLVEEPEK